MPFLVSDRFKRLCGFSFHRRGIHWSAFHCHTHSVANTNIHTDCDPHSNGNLYAYYYKYTNLDFHSDFHGDKYSHRNLHLYADRDLYQYPVSHTNSAATTNYRHGGL